MAPLSYLFQKNLSFWVIICYKVGKEVLVMLVAICDDELIFRDAIKSVLTEYAAAHRLPLDICHFSCADELLYSQKRFDMVFLDYQMPGTDGMEAARVLRSRNITCSIVFVTSYPQFVLESFEVQPFRFLLKPVQPEQIADVMNAYITQQKKFSPIVVSHDNCQTVVDAKDILYLEGSGKYCVIRTVDNTYTSSKTLAQVHTLLPQHCFYRTHKSFVINLYCIRSFDKDTVTMLNGEIAKIGRGKIGEFRQAYAQFVKDYYIKV